MFFLVFEKKGDPKKGDPSQPQLRLNKNGASALKIK